MHTCKNCGKKFQHGEFARYNVCDECKWELRAQAGYPSGGEVCPVCNGTIRYLGSKGWDNGYYCDGCGSEWWYD